MALSASFAVASSHQLSQLCYKQKRLLFLKPHRNKSHLSWIIKSVLDNRSFSSASNNGAIDPDKILLELFTRAQKLEEETSKNPHPPQDIELGANLGMLELDLYSALSALKKKEEELQEAERKVLLEYNEKNHAKKNLDKREKELAAAKIQHEKLEEEIRLASMDLVSQATEINNLKTLLKESDLAVSTAKSALLVKENEIMQMKNELMKMSEETANAESELRSKEILLDEANTIVERQEIELRELHTVIHDKERDLEISRSIQKSEFEKFKNVKAKLEKQTMDWLMVQQELKKLVDETSMQTNGAIQEFGRVGKLLSDVRSELVLSQKALASSKQKIDGHDLLLEKQLKELEEQRKSVTSYMVSLRDVQLELQSERNMLMVVNAQKVELERDLSMERELLQKLQTKLDKESHLFHQAIEEQFALTEKLDIKSSEFDEMQILFEAKESELAEARSEVQYLKSELESLQAVLAQKNLELLDAQKMLKELKDEISELKGVLFSKEQELNELTSMLNEKDEHVQRMQHEVHNANIKFAQAEVEVERIVDLTEEIIMSFNDNVVYSPTSTNENLKKKQLDSEIEFSGESVRAKAMEVVALQRALTIKDDELKLILAKLDAKEKELTYLKGEMMREKDERNQLYSFIQVIIGEKSLVMDELQTGASMLDKIIETSRELLNRDSVEVEADFGSNINWNTLFGSRVNMIKGNECRGEVEFEVSRLLRLTEGIVRDAGLEHTC